MKSYILTIATLFLGTALFAQTSWTTQNSGVTADLWDIFFTDKNHGWAVGDNGTICATTDGGFHWSQQVSGTTNSLHSVFFINNTLGWIAGTSGTILHTSDGGATWSPQTAGSNMYNDIQFVSATEGWVAGSGGSIYKTVDGGATWVNVPCSYFPVTNAMHYFDASHGLHLNTNGHIVMTTDAGANWSDITTGSNLATYALSFPSADTGYVCGLSGQVLKSLNAGLTWTPLSSGTTKAMLGMSFANNSLGWMGGTDGEIRYTTNGGAAWTTEVSGTTNTIRSVMAVNAANVYAAGNAGTIICRKQTDVICMVTVDTASNENKIIWEKVYGQGTASYKVYKLVGSNYLLAGTVPFNSMSEFIDYSSNPSTVADRYKIAVVDSASNESAKSPYHQTILLTSAQGTQPNIVALNWNHYADESGNFMPDYYFIYRGSNPANLQLYDSVTAVFTNYNDNNAFSTYYYQIAIRKPGPCIPTSETKETGGPYSQSVSNMEDNVFESIEENALDYPLYFSPNPAGDYLMITFSDAGNSRYRLEITDITGKLVLQKENISPGNYTLHREDLPAGLYTITISGENMYRGKLVFE